jgi:hypothetical protein
MYSETTADFFLGTSTLWRRGVRRGEEWKVCCTYSEGRPFFSDDEAIDSSHDGGEAVVLPLLSADSSSSVTLSILAPGRVIILEFSIQFNSNQINSCLFTCKLNNTEANYKVSTVIWKYTIITKEQDTKHDSQYNGDKLIMVPRKNKFSINR